MATKRLVITSLTFAACLGGVWCVAKQRQELLQVRAEQQRLVASSAQGSQAAGDQGGGGATAPVDSGKADGVSPELLQLRAEVKRLMQRQHDLAGVAKETEQLQAEWQRVQTNNAAGLRLPPGYIRTSQAQMVGYSTPEATLQTFLWAIKDHNMTHLLESFAPPVRERMQSSIQSGDDFFKAAGVLPGLRIVSRNQRADGSLELNVEIVPGKEPEHFRMESINGQWKIAEGF